MKVCDPIHTIKGDEDLKIINPLDTIIKNTFIHTDIAERNLVLQSLKRFNDRLPPALQFMIRRRDVHPITVKGDEIDRFLKQNGLPVSIGRLANPEAV